jgi:hypothetical protein
MIENLQDIMVAKLRKDGISAEVTFCRDDMFSILVEDSAQFVKAKALFAQVGNVRFDSEVRNEEIGNIAYYRFF